jgi:hypothetical protein
MCFLDIRVRWQLNSRCHILREVSKVLIEGKILIAQIFALKSIARIISVTQVREASESTFSFYRGVLTICCEDAERDEELVARYKCASNIAWSSLRHVHWGKDGETTNTETGDPTTQRDLIPSVRRGNLDNDADAEDDVPENDRVFAAKLVSNRGSD